MEYLHLLTSTKPDGSTYPSATVVEAGMAHGIAQARAAGAVAYRGAVLEALPAITDSVFTALAFESSAKLQTDATTTVFDTLAANHVTNCYGYTAVTAEALSAAGIASWIGHAGNHAFNLVPLSGPTEQGPELFMVDSFRPSLTANIAPALRKVSVAQVATELEQHQARRTTALLSIEGLAVAQGFMSGDHFLAANHFFGFKQTVVSAYRAYQPDKSHQILLSVYPSAVGTLVLKQASAFKAAAYHGDTSRAVEALLAIPGLYPQIDGQAKHTTIRKLAQTLCAKGEIAQAQAVVEAYASSFVLCQDPRLQELEGDLWGTVAAAAPNTALTQRARACYEGALQTTHYAWGKRPLLKKLQNL